MRNKEVSANLKSRRLLPPLTRSPSLSEGGFSLTPLYHKSAEKTTSLPKFMCIRRGDLRSPAGEHSSPLPYSQNILMRRSVTEGIFVLKEISQYIVPSKQYLSQDISHDGWEVHRRQSVIPHPSAHLSQYRSNRFHPFVRQSHLYAVRNQNYLSPTANRWWMQSLKN